LKRLIFAVFVLFYWNILPVDAQDLIILRDGNVIEAKVEEISPAEIRYRRFNHLSGPMIVIPRSDVLSIKYENGTTEIMNPVSTPRQEINQPGVPNYAQSGAPSSLQQILNGMPAVSVAGNNLKFEFIGETWIARVNGENFSRGTIEFEATSEGGVLTLKQTHIWPGAAGKTAGRVANIIPGGGAAGSALNTAGNIAGAAGEVEMTGPVILLEYKAGPPASLKLVSSSNNNEAKARAPRDNSNKTANIRNNWISAELAAIGVGLRYERMLNSNVSLGVNYYYGGVFGLRSLDYFDINAFIRAYPTGKSFFFGFGLGYADYYYYKYLGYRIHNGNYFAEGRNFGVTFNLELGWKIDVGEAGGFYLMPCLTFPLVFGSYESIVGYRFLYFGMGVAF